MDVLGGKQLDRPAIDALHLAGDLERLAEEVDVAELDPGGLAQPQAGERRGR